MQFIGYSYPSSTNATKAGFGVTGCYHYEKDGNRKSFAAEVICIQEAMKDGVDLYRFDVHGNHKKLTA